MVTSETTTASTTPTETVSLDEGNATALTELADQLTDTTPDEISIYEGEMSGALYLETETEINRSAFTETGLTLTTVSEVTEEVTPLAQIEPDPGESVHDAVDSLSFAGD